MLRNYLKTALRFLKQNKVFAAINAMGLAIALAASFIILLFVINELSYDRYHKNNKRIFRVLNYYKDFNTTMAGTPYVLSEALIKEFPQVEKSVRLRNMRAFKLKLKDEYINVQNAMATDSEVFDIFTLPLIMGSSAHNLIPDKSSIVLSRDLAVKLFPGQNPIGKEIAGMANDEEHMFNVTGVFENIPLNSTLKAQCFINSSWTLDPINKAFKVTDADKNWTFDFWNTWVLLAREDAAKTLESQFNAFEIKNISEKPHNHYSLQNLSKVYLDSQNIQNSFIQGNKKNIKLFSAIALLIILVAAINYIILSTAVSAGRAKEIGIRKTFGAGNSSIKNQLFSESILLAVLVLPISLLLMWLSLPYAGKLFETELHLIKSNIIVYVLVYLLLTVFIGVASGVYTSTYLSRLKVLDILKNITTSGKRKLVFRSALIVIQLIIFCTFVACTFIIRSQYLYALKKDPGYYNTDILTIDLGRDFKGYSSYINNIKSNPNIIMASGSMDGLPMQNSMTFMYPNFQNKEIQVHVEGFDVDYNFLETMGIKLIKGRDFSRDFGSDMGKACILNETAVKQLGIIDPIGKKIGDSEIIGIVKDFNLHSIHTEIPVLDIAMTDRYIDQVAVHYKPGTLKSILPVLEAEWKKAAPDRPFHYTTIEDLIKEIYSSEKNLTTIVSIFALFTLLIAAFGLFGLTLFVTRSRTKEIGIKKVFGSTEKSIVFSLLTGNFIQVIVASLLSVPVTLYFMINWLKNFSYKTEIGYWVFGISFITALLVVLITVFFQSYKASRINPVEAIRYE
jgi:putative ABC transport system permease protein